VTSSPRPDLVPTSSRTRCKPLRCTSSLVSLLRRRGRGQGADPKSTHPPRRPRPVVPDTSNPQHRRSDHQADRTIGAAAHDTAPPRRGQHEARRLELCVCSSLRRRRCPQGTQRDAIELVADRRGPAAQRHPATNDHDPPEAWEYMKGGGAAIRSPTHRGPGRGSGAAACQYVGRALDRPIPPENTRMETIPCQDHPLDPVPANPRAAEPAASATWRRRRSCQQVAARASHRPGRCQASGYQARPTPGARRGRLRRLWSGSAKAAPVSSPGTAESSSRPSSQAPTQRRGARCGRWRIGSGCRRCRCCGCGGRWSTMSCCRLSLAGRRRVIGCVLSMIGPPADRGRGAIPSGGLS
jgi:hypothetical protein